MRRIILFRYHHKFERNRELLKFMKYLNPGIEIYGLYGGPSEKLSEANDILGDVMTYNYLITGKDSTWKWKHSDMAYQLWYRDYGHKVDFDIMHSVEWDLLYFEPLDKLFGHGDKNTLILSGLIPLENIADKWYWTKHETEKPEWNKLLNHFREKLNYDMSPFGMIGPGTTLPRSFLEKIKDIEIPGFSNDELRIPLLAQANGFKMADSGFFKKWFSKSELKYFNSNAVEVKIKNIESQLKKGTGRRAFHPYNEELTLSQLKDLYDLTINKKSSDTPKFKSLFKKPF